MNRKVRSLAREYNLDSDDCLMLRLAFGLSCVDRVSHLLEQQAVLDVLQSGHDFVAGKIDYDRYQQCVETARQLASSHPGSVSIDGSGHAAVSATFSVARALAGDAWNAAEYAAYASVYAYSGHAVTDPDAFAAEYRWQEIRLQELVTEYNLR